MGFYINGQPVGNFRTFLYGLLSLPLIGLIVGFFMDVVPFSLVVAVIIGLVFLLFIIGYILEKKEERQLKKEREQRYKKDGD